MMGMDLASKSLRLVWTASPLHAVTAISNYYLEKLQIVI